MGIRLGFSICFAYRWKILRFSFSFFEKNYLKSRIKSVMINSTSWMPKMLVGLLASKREQATIKTLGRIGLNISHSVTILNCSIVVTIQIIQIWRAVIGPTRAHALFHLAMVYQLQFIVIKFQIFWNCLQIRFPVLYCFYHVHDIFLLKFQINLKTKIFVSLQIELKGYSLLILSGIHVQISIFIVRINICLVGWMRVLDYYSRLKKISISDLILIV